MFPVQAREADVVSFIFKGASCSLILLLPQQDCDGFRFVLDNVNFKRICFTALEETEEVLAFSKRNLDLNRLVNLRHDELVAAVATD